MKDRDRMQKHVDYVNEQMRNSVEVVAKCADCSDRLAGNIARWWKQSRREDYRVVLAYYGFLKPERVSIISVGSWKYIPDGKNWSYSRQIVIKVECFDYEDGGYAPYLFGSIRLIETTEKFYSYPGSRNPTRDGRDYRDTTLGFESN